jgi:hypothetical protein
LNIFGSWILLLYSASLSFAFYRFNSLFIAIYRFVQRISNRIDILNIASIALIDALIDT